MTSPSTSSRQQQREIARFFFPAPAFAALTAAATLILTGCAGAPAAFSPSYPDNDDGAIRDMLARVQAAPAQTPRSIAVGIATDPARLYAFDMQARKILWQQATDTWFTPVLAGDYILCQESKGVIIRDLLSGKQLLVLDYPSISLKGADASGNLVAVVLGRGESGLSDYQVVAIRNNSLAWRRELSSVAGTPAVVGDIVVVPWSHQYLTALDGRTGKETARIRVLDTVVGHAFKDRGTLYGGSTQKIFPLSQALLSRTVKSGPFYLLPEKKIPGQPLLLPDMYAPDPIPAPDSARHHIQFSWLPVGGGQTGLGLEDNTIYLSFYRFILALDPDSFELRWIYTNPEDLVGAQAQPGGVLFADEGGEMGLLSAATGQVQWKASIGLPTQVVTFADGAMVSPASIGEAKTRPLSEQLLTAAQHPDARLVPIRLMLVELLAVQDDSASTAGLIDLCENRRNTPPVRDAACKALGKREVGAEHVLEALKQHAAFLEGSTAPPVGSLAKAAARLKESRAVGLLIAHLRDPNTPSADLSALVVALKDLNDRAAAQPLVDFLRMYHADTPDDQVTEALGETIDALVSLSGPAAVEILTEIAGDALGNTAVRHRARQALQAIEKAKEEAEKSEAERQAAMQKEAAAQQEVAAKPQAPLEQFLSKAAIEKTLEPVSDKLQACLAKDSNKPRSAVLLMVIHRGDIMSIHVQPASLQGCIEPLVRSQKFPITKTAKERITYALEARSPGRRSPRKR
jgi:outer membrane protein assembly factor BamB